MSEPVSGDRTDTDPLDLVVIGAGVSGLYGLHKFRGLGFAVRAFEKGPDIGGTWYWNAYPGAHCDVYSWDYSYSFSPELVQEWSWSERYATQAEIMRYLHHVADRFGLWDDIELNTAVQHVHFNDETDRWDLTLGDGRVVRTRYVLDATGILSVPTSPDIPGIEDFGGTILHTGQWPQDGIDVVGKRVGLIGTGSSGSQVAPWLAQNAAGLTVFQRRPAYVIPAHHYQISPEEEAEVKRTYQQRRADLRYSFGGVPIAGTELLGTDADDETVRRRAEAAWAEGGNAPMQLCFADMAVNRETNDRVSEIVREKGLS